MFKLDSTGLSNDDHIRITSINTLFEKQNRGYSLDGKYVVEIFIRFKMLPTIIVWDDISQ